MGSSFDNFLEEEGLLENAEAEAIKRVTSKVNHYVNAKQ
jgi:hypothetical protein